MIRQIITIDEELCDGCGLCIPGCPEGALQIIDGKARLVSDLFCDGLGACIGDCPQGAISTEMREAEPYNEAIVMENIMAAGMNTIKAHLKHLLDYDEIGYYNEAIEILKKNGYDLDELLKDENLRPKSTQTDTPETDTAQHESPIKSELMRWPVKLALVNPDAGFFNDADLLITADCVPFAYGDFHRRFVKGKVVITFCPKFDPNIETYIDKLAHIFKVHNIKSVTLLRMDVFCCGGIELILQQALERAGKTHFVKLYTIDPKGNIT